MTQVDQHTPFEDLDVETQRRLERKAKFIWVGMIVGFLGLSVTMYGIAIGYSMTDESFSVVEDYEAKAANWDEHMAQQTRNAELGWLTDLDVVGTGEPREVELRLSVFDKYGKPVRGADVHVNCFPIARGNDRIEATLSMTGDGMYSMRTAISRAGVWMFEVSIAKDDDVYTETIRKEVYPRMQ
jgi:nitrogen fixation protein FixH